MKEALTFLDPQDRDTWIATGHALKLELGEDGLEIYQQWSKRRPDGSTPTNYLGAADVEKTWGKFNPDRTSVGTIMRRAEARGYVWNNPLSDDIESMIEKINRDWFVVFESGKVFVCRQRVNAGTGYKDLEYFTPDEFHKAFANKIRFIDKKPQKESKLWFENPKRREYPLGTVCDPTGKADSGYFNTWSGFAITPSDDDPSPLVNHIDQVVAGGTAELSSYIKGWLAVAVQRPEKPAETVLVLRGRQGTGKGLLGTAMINIFGMHSQHITRSDHLIGRFQSHLQDCLFLFADEAFFPGDPKIKGQLKSLVTERMLTIEAKYRPPKMLENRLSILMASNEDFVVPAEMDDRRFFVTHVSENYRNDRDYFASLWNVVNGLGLGGFLRFLLQYDLSGFDIRAIPETAARTEQKTFMLDSGGQFILWALQRGAFYRAYDKAELNEYSYWNQFCTTQLLYDCYERWHNKERIRRQKLDQRKLGELFTKFADPSRPAGNHTISIVGEIGERPPGYQFGTLEAARKRFEEGFGLSHIVWGDPNAAPIEDDDDDIPF